MPTTDRERASSAGIDKCNATIDAYVVHIRKAKRQYRAFFTASGSLFQQGWIIKISLVENRHIEIIYTTNYFILTPFEQCLYANSTTRAATQEFWIWFYQCPYYYLVYIIFRMISPI